MKRAISIFIAVIVIFSIFSDIASAEKTLKTKNISGGFLPCESVKATGIELKDLPRSATRFSGFPKKSLYDFIEEQLRAKAETITPYPTYKVTYTEFLQTLRAVLFDNYDIMAYDEIGPYYYHNDNFVSFNPQYYTPEEGEAEAIAMMQAEAEEYLLAADEVPENDIIGKVLVIHDMFCKNNRYAIEEYNAEICTGIINNEPRTAYYLFKNKKAVCQGNCIALKLILDKLDERLGGNVIKTGFCSSDAIGHIWNTVKIDGQWYFIDETYDDPVYYYSADEVVEIPYASHSYFLASADALEDHTVGGVCDWVYYGDEEVVCDDKRYEDGYIFGSLGGAETVISYEMGRYKIDVHYFPYPFWSESIRLSTLLTTDVFMEGTSKHIYYYAGGEVNAKLFWAQYDGEGRLTDCNEELDVSFAEGFANLSYQTYIPDSCRVFHWSEDMEPLCAVIEVK